MDFKVLAVGDVVGEPGLDRVCRSLRRLKRESGADFVIVNGENASNLGMTPQQGDEILDAGGHHHGQPHLFPPGDRALY